MSVPKSDAKIFAFSEKEKGMFGYFVGLKYLMSFMEPSRFALDLKIASTYMLISSSWRFTSPSL